MTLFWILVALITLASLLFIWWPALKQRQQTQALDRNAQNVAIFKERLSELEEERKQGNLDDENFESLKRELELNLLQEVDDSDLPQLREERSLWLPVGLSLLVPVLAVYLYLQWGASTELAMPRQQQQASHPDSGHDMQGIEQQIANLEARLQENPDNSQGWFTLGRTYMTLNRYEEAFNAFTRVGELVGEHAEILSQQAQAIYFGAGHRVTPEVEAIIKRALELDPDDPGTIGLLGISAYESGQYVEAIEYWQRLLRSDRPNINREGLQSAVAQAQEQLRQQGIDYQVQPVEPAASAELTVAVALAPELAAKAAPDTTVFVYAQAVQGPRMPLAVAKLRVSDLPTRVVLNDAMAMGPMMKLSSVDQVQIKATVSFSGTPGTKSGDLTGVVSPIAVHENSELINVLIDQQVQ
ncbi:c-type cytochrome biogenesis protein CcmI [Motiliproteus sediminis]|uniref:c-type cytochrome biogenesis protein CcmI n=1 Tax=Motiliproteus sediminis TaxID=1468178 RepID=UPI001AEFF050|nr:c-type cytochrome biogenesis protein CcmI [Motiliproteus sediminis]